MKDHPGPRQTWESDRDYDARLTMWDRSVAAEGVGKRDTLTEERIPVELQLVGITSETPTEGETNMSTIAETTLDRAKTDELKAALAEAEQQEIRDLQEAGRKVITCTRTKQQKVNHPTVENLELAIEAVAIPCEGKLHAHGVGGHNPLQLAAAGISWGCPHCASELTTLIICAGRLDQLTGDAANGERVGCDDCGRSAALAEFIRQIIPLTSH